MSTFASGSRYPRPLKATHSLDDHQSWHLSPPSRQPPPLINNSCHHVITSPDSPSHIHPSNTRTANDDQHISNMDLIHDTNSLSPSLLLMAGQRRRSNSLSSLDEKTTMWTQTSDRYTETLHKRSNSCSNADNINKLQTGDCGNSQHSRRSIEGLNQEVSSVLEGKSLVYKHCHPDGHIAPVSDLLLGNSSCALHSPLSSSPFSTDSPMVVDTYPLIPKIAFDHEPPISAERCKLKQELFCLSDGYIPMAPDKSKANIVFRGNVFGPPLHTSHSLQTVSII